MHYELSTQWN